MALVEASPTGFSLKGTFPIPGAVPRMGSIAPVVTGGRLYLRDPQGWPVPALEEEDLLPGSNWGGVRPGCRPPPPPS
jgi:hypothetical protein